MPEMFVALNFGITGRAIEQGLAKLALENPRDWATGDYRRVDDKPYGGGPGMVMLYEPLHKAIQHAKQKMPTGAKVVYLSPQGKLIHQNELNQLVQTKQALIFLAGRYEGIDERIVEHDVDEEWSIGDFVISGGEFAAMVYIDALIRLIPGALGHQESAQQDSFMHGLLDHPHYTRPDRIDNHAVPDVLMNGNHRDIVRWRRKQALGKTWLKRPDLLDNLVLNEADQALLLEFKHEHE